MAALVTRARAHSLALLTPLRYPLHVQRLRLPTSHQTATARALQQQLLTPEERGGFPGQRRAFGAEAGAQPEVCGVPEHSRSADSEPAGTERPVCQKRQDMEVAKPVRSGQTMETLQGYFRDCEPFPLKQEETSKAQEEQRRGRIRAGFQNYPSWRGHRGNEGRPGKWPPAAQVAEEDAPPQAKVEEMVAEERFSSSWQNTRGHWQQDRAISLRDTKTLQLCHGHTLKKRKGKRKRQKISEISKWLSEKKNATD